MNSSLLHGGLPLPGDFLPQSLLSRISPEYLPMLQYWVVPFALSLTANLLVTTSAELLDRFASNEFYMKHKTLYRGKRSRNKFSVLVKEALWAELLIIVSSAGATTALPQYVTVKNEWPSFVTAFTTMLACMFIHDFWNYWLHRAMHHFPWLYKNVHAKHHDLREPSALGAIYASPIDMLLVGFGMSLAVIIVKPDYISFLCFVFFQTLQDVSNHTGWNLPFSPLSLLPFKSDTKYHDLHHRYGHHAGPAKNLAGAFWILDWAFGTMSRFDPNKTRSSKSENAEVEE